MPVEAKRPINSIIYANSEVGLLPEDAFPSRARNGLIAEMITGKIGIVTSGQIPRREAFSFVEDNYLRTDVSEEAREGGTRNVVVDTKYVPSSIDGRNYTLRPEIAVRETMSGTLGDVTRVDTVRELPPGASKVVAETMHRLIAGLLLDGGAGEDIIRVYDKAMASLHEGTANAPRDFIKAFRDNSRRGGTFGYRSFRYANSIVASRPQNNLAS